MRSLKWLKYGIFSAGLILSVLGIFFWILDYNDFISYTSELLGVREKAELISQKLFPLLAYRFLSFGLVSMGLLTVFFAKVISTKIRNAFLRINEDLTFLANKAYNSIKELTVNEKLALFFILFSVGLLRCFVLIHYELLVDEAFSYIFFISKGPVVTMAYYPGPNNHIFYNLLCSFLDFFPFPAYWTIKLPSLILGLILPAILFIYLIKRSNLMASLAATIFLSGQELFLSYTLLGRGYVLMTLLTFLGIVSYLEWKRENQKAYLTLFIFSSVLGFYTIPVYLYPFSAILVHGMVLNRKTERINFLKANIKIFLWVGFLYSPVIALNGISAITSNSWVQPIEFVTYLKNFPTELFNYCLLISDNQMIIFIFLVLILASPYLLKFEINSLFYFIYFIPPMIFFFQRVVPYDRVWTYFTVVNALIFALFLNQINSRKLLYSLAGVIISYSIWGNGMLSISKLKETVNYSEQTDRIAELGKKHIFTDDDSYNVFLRLSYLEKKQALELDVYDFDIKKQYDVLVLAKNKPFPSEIIFSKYEILFENEFVSTFVSK